MKVPFAEWLPDQPALDNPGALVIYNALPEVGGFYSPMRRPASYTEALPAQPRGHAVFRDKANVTHIYAGTPTNIYELSGRTWLSRGSGYSAGIEDIWEFVDFENQLIVSNFTDPIQAAVHGNSLADLSASAPRARHIAVVDRFLMTGYTNDTDGITPNRVRWSPLDNPFGDWTPSATTQADFRNLRIGGAVQRIFGGDYGIVIQERAIQRISFVSGAKVFRFDVLKENLGTNAPQSVVKHGNIIWFWGTGGFQQITGDSITPIGEGKVNDYIRARLDATQLYRFSAAVDPDQNMVYWKVPTVVEGDLVLAYNWNAQRFVPGDANDIERFGLSATSAATLEDIDTIYNVDIDSPPLRDVSLDSGQFKGSQAQLGVFNDAFELCTLTGDQRVPTLQTAETQVFDSRRAFLTGVKTLVNDGNDIVVRIGSREFQNKPVIWTGYVGENPIGLHEFRVDSFYHRAEIQVRGGFSKAIGIDIPRDEVSESGER